MRIIGLMGRAQSGKDTVGRMLCEIGHGRAIAFADRLKQLAMTLFNLSHDDVYTDAGKEAPTQYPCFTCPICKKSQVEQIVLDKVPHCRCLLCGAIGEPKPFTSFWTPRMILQHLGTEGCRAVDKNVWVRLALEDAAQYPNYDFVVITDCRFKSEMDAILANGGEVWRIKRPSAEASQAGIQGHASELEQASIPDEKFNVVITNDGTLDDLRAKVRSSLKPAAQAPSAA